MFPYGRHLSFCCLCLRLESRFLDRALEHASESLNGMGLKCRVPQFLIQEAAAQLQALQVAATASDPVQRVDVVQACQHLQRNFFFFFNKWTDELACVGWGPGDSNLLKQIV